MNILNFAVLATLVTFLCASNSSQADVFTTTYVGEVQTSGFPNPVGVNNGDPLTWTFFLDNGGSTSVNQTWMASDFIGFTLDVGNGSYVASATTPLLFDFTVGTFQTDDMGTLIELPTLWIDNRSSGAMLDTLGGEDFGWNFSGNNDVVVFLDSESNFYTVGFADVQNNTNPLLWSSPIADVLVGDVNCDGSIDLLDVGPFVASIVSSEFDIKADVNQDDSVNLIDVAPFVELLSGG